MRACEYTDCPTPAAAKIVTVLDDACSPETWLCGEHIVEEAERVRDEPEFYGLGGGE